MSLIEIIRQTDSHTFLSPQTRKFHKLGQFVVPAWALRQPRLKTGILLATLIALAVLSASSTVALSAPHSQGVAGVSAISIGFGSVVVNTTSPAQHLAVENTGSASLFISRVALSGTYASRFAQSNNCPSSLAVGASCTISLTFTPNTPGNSSATLIVWTAGLGSRKSVSLNGVGVTGGTPAAGLSPGSLAFASQPVGKTSGAGTATLDNAGTAALSISSVTITGANPGDFAQANNCGSSLSAGSSCTFNITFTPAASGSRTALLSVADNSAGSPQTVSLSGTGTVASASLSPTSLSFGNQSVNTTSGVLAATLTNGGTAALSLSSIALTGAN
ncbi:MAG: choice-of-anchor D domain-containing protein, partial [Terriglobia bacterium]